MRTFVGVLALIAVAGFVQASEKQTFKAQLSGYEEVPAISTTGTGTLHLRVVDEQTLEFVLTYANLEGTTTTAAHVHVGQTSVNGGVGFFLCGGGGRAACDSTFGSYTGTITAADIVGPAGQGVAALEFAELLKAIRAGVTYVNVHTNKHPGGEIRGQIK